MSDNTKAITFVYHYTDWDTAERILNSGIINISQKATKGPGVYLTEIDPLKGKNKVIINNWDGALEADRQNVLRDYRYRVMVAFQFIAEEINANKTLKVNFNRNEWIAPNDLNLLLLRPKMFLIFDRFDTTGKRWKIRKMNGFRRDPEMRKKIRRFEVIFLDPPE